MAGIAVGRLKSTVSPRWAETKLRHFQTAAMSTTPVSNPLIRWRPAPADSEAIAAASTSALYAGLVVKRTRKRQAADHAATALAFKGSSYALASGGGAGDGSVALT